MKSIIKNILQNVLGFNTYLFVFAIYIIKTLKWNKKEGDFLFFLKQIPDGGKVLDIGANIGIMTVHLARHLKNSRVYAFEPIPANLKTLQRIVRYFHLPNVKVMDVALGDKITTMEMVMPVVKSVKMQGLSHVVHKSIHEFNEGDKFSVEVKTLDSIAELNKEDQKIEAIKMDVENFEYFVLLGGSQLIDRNRPLIYTELWENENRQKCFSFIRGKNYKIRVLENKHLVDFDEAKHTTQNFFFVPEQNA